jgi:D-alanyl-D-alanine carboxypeptidase/D-alanyl-D-alanine-endopeptidase (penicillin-binding protein 4)
VTRHSLRSSRQSVATFVAFGATLLLSPGLLEAIQQPAVKPAPVRRTGADLELLQANLARLLSDPALDRAHVGLIVQAAGSGEVLFEHQADKRYTAASTTKLVTGAVALHRLGGAHQWQTRLVADGTVLEGTLTGDLWVVGGGDPRVQRHKLGEWARAVRSAGIRRIDGDLVGDDRAFDGPVWGEGWMWDDLFGGWGAGVSSLQLSPASIPGELRPGAGPGEMAELRILESGTKLPILNRVRTGAPRSEVRLRFRPSANTREVMLEGWIPADAERVPLSLAPPHPTLHLLDVFSRALAAEGVQLTGKVRLAGEQERAASPSWDRTFESQPLSQILTRMLKRSDNQIAEALLRTLGAEEDDSGSAEAGLEVVGETLSGWGIEPDAVSIFDGSGLSRYTEIAPRALARLLRRTSQLPEFDIFREALPVASVDGTLSRRFVSTAASGLVQAKTGSLAGVRGLAGFVQDGDRETLIFALLLNGYDAPGDVATALEDLLIEQLALYHGPDFPEERGNPPR